MRVCFRSSVQPELMAEYKQRHAAVWPEMLSALKNAGWNNYSLFLAPDGQLIGYLECEDYEAAQARMALTDVNARWQAEMATLFANSDVPPDQGFRIPKGTSMNTTESALGRLGELAIEVPSWAYGNSGTRFKVFGTPGTPRTVQEKIADAAKVHAHRPGPDGGAAHPVGQGRRLRRAARRTLRDLGVGWAPSTPTPSRTTTTSSAP
jgi:L-rhamnose mutarotase